MREQDISIWEAAKPYLDVRSNEVHTLHSYVFVQRLLEFYTEADADIVLPAIILHDTGWKKIPEEKILQSIGPKKKYPELQRQHELESVKIATAILEQHQFSKEKINAIIAIIDGHDTTAEARSLNDAVLKDSDKLWRYTAHGIYTIGSWFSISKSDVLDILEGFVLPKFLTEQGLFLAKTALEIAKTEVKTFNINEH